MSGSDAGGLGGLTDLGGSIDTGAGTFTDAYGNLYGAPATSGGGFDWGSIFGGSGGGGGLGGLGGILGGGGGGGGGTLGQLLPLLSGLLQQHTQGFGGSFPHVTPYAAPGRTEPLQFGAAPVAPVTSPAERLALVMRGMG